MARRKVLIAEDSPMMAKYIQACLEETGTCDTEVVADGAVALKLILTKPYALVILDNEMPGLRGLDVLRRLGTLTAFQTPAIVLVTSLVTAEIVQAIKTENLPVMGLLTKPFSKDDFLARIEKVVPQTQRGPDDAPDDCRMLFQHRGDSLAAQVVATNMFVGASFTGSATIAEKTLIGDAFAAIINASPNAVVVGISALQDFDEYFLGHTLVFLGTFLGHGRTPYLVIGETGPCTERLKRLGVDQIIRSFPTNADFYQAIGYTP